ncbi:hypothetical protein KNP414_03295 [Paenibacillus mucilaginosus KNP414]|uniref:Uncharacterized protein n=1 Tax=Paenibacillus mucilaginosus (strain KNP414) TaxID=1036673 RepID=F8FFD5_PAEMK|nr:hypothetical protein KNP414_03295 [Paenibacillus mucilaginosus KNP414]
MRPAQAALPAAGSKLLQPEGIGHSPGIRGPHRIPLGLVPEGHRPVRCIVHRARSLRRGNAQPRRPALFLRANSYQQHHHGSCCQQRNQISQSLVSFTSYLPPLYPSCFPSYPIHEGRLPRRNVECGLNAVHSIHNVFEGMIRISFFRSEQDPDGKPKRRSARFPLAGHP